MLNVYQIKSFKKTSHLAVNFLKIKGGITLIELIISISIISILTSITLPNLSTFVVQMRVDNEISMLQRLLLVARNSAINHGERVIVCPLTSGGKCTTEWHKELSVFIDNNNNKAFDSDNEILLITKSIIKSGDKLVYGKSRVMVAFQPTGHLTGLSNGTFRYCPHTHADKSRGIVVARSGRFYASSDINNDGRDETRSNKKIACN